MNGSPVFNITGLHELERMFIIEDMPADFVIDERDLNAHASENWAIVARGRILAFYSDNYSFINIP